MTFTFALCQANFTVGDIPGNLARIAGFYDAAKTAGADMVICSEMVITGYPPEDLVLRKGFQRAAMDAVDELAEKTLNGPALLTGGLWCENEALYNSVFLMENGETLHRQYKRHLPNYGVFDEKRLFTAGPMPEPVAWHDLKLGFLICEDMWEADVSAHLKKSGADLLISINASPFEVGKGLLRQEIAAERVKETGLPLIYVNQIGGQDELVFDGGSFVLACNGNLRASLRTFAEDFSIIILRKNGPALEPDAGVIQTAYTEEETIYRAMVLGLKDFVRKNGFKGVVLGLSGGIDSAISAAVAVDALGKDNVCLVMMPSPYTSQTSIEDAEECAKRLQVPLQTVSIEPSMKAFEAMLSSVVSDRLKDVTAQNIQPRTRGAILMAISNNEGLMLLTTGNKSEMSVGYATLYGDMCGGYSVLKDLYKTIVYTVARWRNAQGEVIPERIFTKAPTAELKFDQTDQDSLPPYDLLDAILLCLVERQLSVAETVAEGYDASIVKQVAQMLYMAEYKRRQAPPGVKLTGMAFGRDRRYPIVNGWRS